MNTPGETNCFRYGRAGWLALVVLAASTDPVEAGCGEHVRTIVGGVFGLESLDTPPEPTPTPPPRCSGPQCSRKPTAPGPTTAPKGFVIEAWADVAEGIAIGESRPSSRVVLAPSVRPIRHEQAPFRPPR